MGPCERPGGPWLQRSVNMAPLGINFTQVPVETTQVTVGYPLTGGANRQVITKQKLQIYWIKPIIPAQ